MSLVAERMRRAWDTGVVVRVTRFGLGFVLVTLVVAVGATNTGNNGLYLLLALFFAVLVVSGVLSRRNVARLVPDLRGPEEIFALEPSRFVLTLREDLIRKRAAILVSMEGEGEGGPWLFPSVEPGMLATRSVELVFPRRGRHQVKSVVVFSPYPIGLFQKGRRHSIQLESVVFPRPLFRPLPLPEVAHSGLDGGASEQRGRGAGVRNLRDFLPGDDPRDIHWAQTARQGSLIVRERDSEEAAEAIVVVDGADERFEEAISEATGAVLQLLGSGVRVGLIAGQTVVPPHEGRVQRRALLAALALARSSAHTAGTEGEAGVPVYRIRPGRAPEELR
jgi:uncharacterized protein (DUF58 family)